MYTVKSGIIGFWPYLTRTRTNGQSRSSNVGSMLGQRRRRWANIEPTLGEQQCLLGVYRWTNNLYTLSQEADIQPLVQAIDHSMYASVFSCTPVGYLCDQRGALYVHIFPTFRTQWTTAFSIAVYIFP